MRLEFNVPTRYNMAIHYFTNYQTVNRACNNCYIDLPEYQQARSLYVNIEQSVLRYGYLEEHIALPFIYAVADLMELLESEMSERAWKPYEDGEAIT